MGKRLIWLLVGIVGVGVVFVGYNRVVRKPTGTIGEKVTGLVSSVKKVAGNNFGVTEDTPGYDKFVKLLSGGPGKDGIPALSNPKFDDGQWLDDGDVVFVVEGEDERRVYPQRILDWHEMVNDEIDGKPILITFCPLCGSAIGFDRRVDGQVLEFGVSGLLFNSNLVMFDRQTDSLWQQIGGEGIVGEHFGKKLDLIRVDSLLWSQVKRDDGKKILVLSRDTGYTRNYNRSPYGDYEQNDSVYFPIEGSDSRLGKKEVVYGVVVNDQAVALVESKLSASFEVTAGKVIMRGSFENGQLRLTRRDTGREMLFERDFWFAWAAFHPETAIFPE